VKGCDVSCRDERTWTQGVFLVDKPVGLTSFALVRRIRWLLGIKKVGHAGTLDPFASGLLIVCAGREATRQINQLMAGRKTYLACLQLGAETSTLDPEGTINATCPVPHLDQTAVQACLKSYIGPQFQVPPPFSAAKHKGKPLYAYARRGILIQKEAKPIEVYRLDYLAYDAVSHQLTVLVECSPGTYIRVLAADIGRSLGCGAYLESLRRTRSGPFTVEESLSGKILLEENGLQLLCSNRRSIDEVLETIGQPSLCTCNS